jgi:hypothetical protein
MAIWLYHQIVLLEANSSSTTLLLKLMDLASLKTLSGKTQCGIKTLTREKSAKLQLRLILGVF